MKPNQIISLMQRLQENISNGHPKQIYSEFYISKRGVPCITVEHVWGVCYFGKGDFFRIFKDGEKYKDIKTYIEVVDFFQN